MSLNLSFVRTTKHHNMSQTLETLFNEGQKLIYGRRRIIDAFYQRDEKYQSIQATDITNISLEDDLICCQVEDTQLFIERSEVIKNFWQHRTRTPSYFDYKVWSQAISKGPWQGIPVAALDYGPSTVTTALEPLLGRVPRISTDRDGVQRLYFVMPEEQMCSCDSWSCMHEHRKELEAEFEQFTDIKFVPICKHLQWYESNIVLHTLSFHAREKQREEYNPRICVYHFDHRHGNLLYRVTNDGIKANAQWLPVAGWKEKPVYDSNGMPTGECWNVLTNALTQDPPYQLHQYSQTVAGVMNIQRSK